MKAEGKQSLIFSRGEQARNARAGARAAGLTACRLYNTGLSVRQQPPQAV